MDRTFNSVGSNIFFEFGGSKEYILPNGKKDIRKEWSIWLSWTSWRITHYNKYIIGSDENPEISIQLSLDKLLGKRFQSLLFISQFLDIEFDFEDGYRVDTFFNYAEEDQWLIFLPNDSEIVIDCSTKESIKSLQALSKQISIKDRFTKINLPILVEKVNEISSAEDKILKLVFANNFSIDLGAAGWRLEKDGEYCGGGLDYYFESKKGQEAGFKNKLFELVGKKIRHIGIDPSGMDARLEFEGGYILEIFTHAQTDPWKISHKGEVLWSANIEI